MAQSAAFPTTSFLIAPLPTTVRIADQNVFPESATVEYFGALGLFMAFVMAAIVLAIVNPILPIVAFTLFAAPAIARWLRPAPESSTR